MMSGVRYLFLILVTLLVLGLLNGLLPVLLIIMGPPAQVTAQDSADFLLPTKPIWLSLFRTWLLKLEDAYDQDKESRAGHGRRLRRGVPVDQRAPRLFIGRRRNLVSVFISPDNFLLYKGCIILWGTKDSIIS